VFCLHSYHIHSLQPDEKQSDSPFTWPASLILAFSLCGPAVSLGRKRKAAAKRQPPPAALSLHLLTIAMASQPHRQPPQQPPPIPPKTPKLPERINPVDLALANELKASWGIAAQDPKTTDSSLVSAMTNSSAEGQAERLEAIGKLKEAGINIEDGWYGPGDLDKAGYGFVQKKRKIRVLSLGAFSSFS